MTQIKLVAIDIDGTLLNSKHELTPQVFEAIQEAKRQGVKIVIATGRPLPGVLDLIKSLKLDEPGNYVITYNGALVQTTDTGEVFIEESLTPDDFWQIDNLARKLGVPMHAIDQEAIYTDNRDIGAYTVHEAFLIKMPLRYRTPEELMGRHFAKMMYVAEPDRLSQVIEQLPESLYKRYTVVKSTPFYLEILSKNASKGLAVKHLAEKLGFTKEETMAIGDEENDRAMLEIVGHPVVMANGNPDLKSIAKHITKSNDEHGVAHALKTWVL